MHCTIHSLISIMLASMYEHDESHVTHVISSGMVVTIPGLESTLFPKGVEV